MRLKAVLISRLLLSCSMPALDGRHGGRHGRARWSSISCTDRKTQGRILATNQQNPASEATNSVAGSWYKDQLVQNRCEIEFAHRGTRCSFTSQFSRDARVSGHFEKPRNFVITIAVDSSIMFSLNCDLTSDRYTVRRVIQGLLLPRRFTRVFHPAE